MNHVSCRNPIALSRKSTHIFPLFGSGKRRIHRTALSSQIDALQLRANFLTPLKIHTTSCIDVACLHAAMFWGKTIRGKETDARQALEEKALAL